MTSVAPGGANLALLLPTAKNRLQELRRKTLFKINSGDVPLTGAFISIGSAYSFLHVCKFYMHSYLKDCYLRSFTSDARSGVRTMKNLMY